MFDSSTKIQDGEDKGKTESELFAEVFDPKVSDIDYLKSRMKALGITQKPKDNE